MKQLKDIKELPEGNKTPRGDPKKNKKPKKELPNRNESPPLKLAPTDQWEDSEIEGGLFNPLLTPINKDVPISHSDRIHSGGPK